MPATSKQSTVSAKKSTVSAKKSAVKQEVTRVPNAKTKKIGKGILASLDNTILRIPLSKITADLRDNPRFNDGVRKPNEVALQYFASKEYIALVSSLNASNGPTTPITVEQDGSGGYRVIDGWSRLQWYKDRNASKNADDVIVPCLVKSFENAADAKVTLNTARINYEPLVAANQYNKMLAANDGDFKRVRQLTGRPISEIKAKLRLLSLPGPMLKVLADGMIAAETADQLMALEGFDAVLAVREHEQSGGAKPSKDVVADAEFMLAAFKFVANEVRKAYELLRKKRTIAWAQVSQFYNEYVAQAVDDEDTGDEDSEGGESDKPSKKKATVLDFIGIAPSGGMIHDAMQLMAGDVLAAYGKKGQQKELDAAIESLLLVGFGAGWSMPERLRETVVNTSGDAKVSAKHAAVMNRYAVNESVASAYMLKNRRTPKKGSVLNLEVDDRARMEVMSKIKTLDDLMKWLDSETVSAAKENKEVAARDAKADKKSGKAAKAEDSDEGDSEGDDFEDEADNF